MTTDLRTPLRITQKNWANVLRFSIIILLVLGIFFRLVNLDKKIAWIDECITSVRIADYYTFEERDQKLLNGQAITIQDLHQSLRVNPNTNAIDLLKDKLAKIPEHPPVYYMMARLAVEWFGNSIAVTRGVAALIGLLVFPCIYWLCLELFGSPLIGWMGVVLFAISPLHVLYAQEARQYTLWIVTILLTSAALLRAMRLNTKLSWVTYAATLVLGLYSHLFFTLVAISHGIYAVVAENFRLSKALVSYLLASVTALLAFSPWLWILTSSLSKVGKSTSWNTQNPSLLTMVKRWVGNLSRVFIDLGLDESTGLRGAALFIPLILMLLILVGYSIYFLCKQTPKQIWFFVITLIVVPMLPLVVGDILTGKIISGTARYTIPFFVGIQLSVIYLLATKIMSPFSKIRQQKLWQMITIALISSGVLSCAISSQAEVWWSKGESKHLTKVAPIINQADQPLLISDAKLARVVSISYLLDPKVRFSLVIEPNIPKPPSDFRNVFLFNASERLQQGIEQEYKLESLYDSEEIQLMKLVSKAETTNK